MSLSIHSLANHGGCIEDVYIPIHAGCIGMHKKNRSMYWDVLKDVFDVNTTSNTLSNTLDVLKNGKMYHDSIWSASELKDVTPIQLHDPSTHTLQCKVWVSLHTYSLTWPTPFCLILSLFWSIIIISFCSTSSHCYSSVASHMSSSDLPFTCMQTCVSGWQHTIQHQSADLEHVIFASKACKNVTMFEICQHIGPKHGTVSTISQWLLLDMYIKVSYGLNNMKSHHAQFFHVLSMTFWTWSALSAWSNYLVIPRVDPFSQNSVRINIPIAEYFGLVESWSMPTRLLSSFVGDCVQSLPWISQ